MTWRGAVAIVGIGSSGLSRSSTETPGALAERAVSRALADAGLERKQIAIAAVCPYCGGTTWTWRKASGNGTIFSFVRYHRSYFPEFADLMPYLVATVQLDEGPRMFGRLVGRDVAARIGLPVHLVVEEWPNGRCVPAFEPAAQTT